MKNASYLIIILLFGWIVFRECSSPPRPLPPSIQANRDSISIKKDHVASLDKAGQAIARKMANDSVRNLEALKRSESRVDGLTKSLASALRRKPELRVDTVYLVMDSLISEQVKQITLLTHDRDTLRSNYASLLSIKDAEIRIKGEIAGHMTAINTELYKNLNRERRRGKIWKVAVPVALVVGFIIGEEL